MRAPGPCLALVAMTALAVACGGGAAPPPRAPSGQGARPKLVVALVLDQLGTDTLEKHLSLLPEDGFLRRAHREGAFHRLAFPYAGTYTAPGHASLATGTVPAVHGVSGNKYWNKTKRKSENGLQDDAYPLIGLPTEATSPRSLRAPTVGDVLQESTHGQAKLVSVSLKDRGAVLFGGHRPNAVLWYEEDIPGVTTSSFYQKELPAWVVEWNRGHPVSGYLEAWVPEDAALLERALGPDEQPGEGQSFDFDATFPHDPRLASRPTASFIATPRSVDYTLDLARAAFEGEALCGDDVPDLLTISISTTDHVGHVFGPDSWEYVDNLRRTDRALAAFTAWVAERCGAVTYVLSSDHGVAPLVERAKKDHPDAVRQGLHTAAVLNEKVSEKLGKGAWIDAFVKPLIHLGPDGEKRRNEVLPVLMAELRSWKSVYAVYDPRDAERLRASADPVERAAGLSIDDPNRGDVLVVPAPYTVWDEGGKPAAGTSHGSPWDYDKHVPGIAWGLGVGPARSTAPLGHGRFAATLAALLGVPAPNANREPPLPGVHVAPGAPEGRGPGHGAATAANTAPAKECPCKKGGAVPPPGPPALRPR